MTCRKPPKILPRHIGNHRPCHHVLTFRQFQGPPILDWNSSRDFRSIPTVPVLVGFIDQISISEIGDIPVFHGIRLVIQHSYMEHHHHFVLKALTVLLYHLPIRVVCHCFKLHDTSIQRPCSSIFHRNHLKLEAKLPPWTIKGTSLSPPTPLMHSGKPEAWRRSRKSRESIHKLMWIQQNGVHTQYAPWCWYVCLHDWVIFRANVGKYSIHGAYGIYTWVGPFQLQCI